MQSLNRLTSGSAAFLTLVLALQTLSGQEASTSIRTEPTEVSNQTNDSPKDAKVLELEDFVVKGNSLYTDQFNALKTPTPIIDVPQSLSILTSDDIALRGFNSIGDIIDYTPGPRRPLRHSRERLRQHTGGFSRPQGRGDLRRRRRLPVQLV